MEDCKILYEGDEDQNLKAGLLEELGFKSIGVHDNMSKCWLMTYDTVGFKHVCTDEGFSELKELTLPQLRDIVVLHRNDVKDATHTHKNFEQAKSIILSATNEVCDWVDGKWKVTCRQVSELKPIQLDQEQGLISGADALRALADGKEVELRDKENNWVRANNHHLVGLFLGNAFDFRLKPRTIKLNLEIPAPFEPKEKDIFWTLSTNYKCGYVQILCYRNDEQGERLAQFGAWRTEEQVKQVVAALRGGIKG